jgi:acetylglutamate kinase
MFVSDAHRQEAFTGGLSRAARPSARRPLLAAPIIGTTPRNRNTWRRSSASRPFAALSFGAPGGHWRLSQGGARRWLPFEGEFVRIGFAALRAPGRDGGLQGPRPAIEGPSSGPLQSNPMTEPLPNVHVRAEVLVQALPHMQRYDEEVVVIKYGGHAMGDPAAAEDFAEDIVLLEQSGIKPIVVHGGGPQIGRMLAKLGIESEFQDGLRVTDAATVEIVEMVLAGLINKQIVGWIGKEGGKAVGLCGKDGNMVTARKVTRTVTDPDSNIEKIVDLGFVGEPEHVNRSVLDAVLKSELIPVLAPVAVGADGQTYNVNADTFSGAIAGAMRAKRLLLLTDVPGVLDKNKNLIPEMTIDDCRRLIADGTITDGMIPKIETCIYALERGVEAVVIIDGKVPHAVLLELFTDHGAGTLIRRG